MAHTHHHHHHTRRGNIGVAFVLNLLFTIVELIGGVLTNSIAIISDAVHDFGDSLSLGLGWYLEKLSKKGSTKKYTYGYKRFSLLGAIVNCVVLLVGSVYIISEAIPRLMSPQQTNAKGMFLLAMVGVVVNGVAALRTRNSSSINERVISLHMLEDMLGWIAVLVGAIVIHYTGWTIIDPILSLLIACFVLFNVFKNIRLVLPILLQGTPPEIETEELTSRIRALDEVEEIHDLHVWSMSEEYVIATLHVVLSRALRIEEQHLLKEQIRSTLQEHGVHHATIEFEMTHEHCSYKEMCNG